MTGSLDVVVRGGRVIDGSGAPAARADIGIRGGAIVHVGELDGARAEQTIDAAGLAVAPGFVDAHVHSDAKIEDETVQLASLAQGVTTHVVGQDGFGFAPTSGESFAFMSLYTSGINGSTPPFGPMSTAELLAWFDGRSPLNVATLVPNGCLRFEADDLGAMRALCERCAEQGAVGLSSGLDYVPSCEATTEELTALARAAGLYVTHVRYELGLGAALAEAFEIGRAGGVPVHVSHLRPDRAFELTAAEILALVDAGGDVTYDLYPYTYGATFLSYLLPHRVFDGGWDEIADTLRRADTREEIRRSKAASRWSWNDAIVSGAPSPPYAELVGLGLEDAAATVGAEAVDFVCDFLLAQRLECLIVWRDRETEDDRRELGAMLAHPRAMIGSDAIYSGGRDHPRGYGAFARFLGEFVRDVGVLSLEEAIRRITSLPADRFGLRGRGRLAVGFAADLVIFDPKAIEPPDGDGFARGVRDVLVNGTRVFHDGVLTGARPGRGLRRAAPKGV